MLKKVFEVYGEIYKRILTHIYPAKNSTGFPERNLSVNFSKAYEEIARQKNQIAYTWFEFQFGKLNNRHVDAVIVNETLHEMYIIEAKRFSNPTPKTREIGRDIVRILELFKELKEETRIQMNNIEKCYGVILADVWEENQGKIAIYESYKKGDFMNKLQNTIDSQSELKYELKNVQYFIQSMKEIKDGEKYKDDAAVNKYHLVSFCGEICAKE